MDLLKKKMYWLTSEDLQGQGELYSWLFEEKDRVLPVFPNYRHWINFILNFLCGHRMVDSSSQKNRSISKSREKEINFLYLSLKTQDSSIPENSKKFLFVFIGANRRRHFHQDPPARETGLV